MMAYELKQLTGQDKEQIIAFYTGVFTQPPWNDDWSDKAQLASYIEDLTGNKNSVAFGFFQGEEMVGLSMGSIRHWYQGTEYFIDEFCVRTDLQGQGIGTAFLKAVEDRIRTMGVVHIFLLTDCDVPAFAFYRKNGFTMLEKNTALKKTLV